MSTNKKQKHGFFARIFKMLALLVAAVLIVYIGLNVLVLAVGGKRIITPEEAANLNADCVMVLGAHVFSSGRLSDMLADRVDTAIGLYKSGASPKLLMSGDHGGEFYDEVNAMKSYAIERGVPPEDIFMDHAGFSTYESVYRLRDIFCAKRVIIVSQSYHLYRALFIARALGLEAYGVPADLRDYRGMLYNNLRESLARVKDVLMSLIKPSPTYLGETYDLKGDGHQTDDSDKYIDINN